MISVIAAVMASEIPMFAPIDFRVAENLEVDFAALLQTSSNSSTVILPSFNFLAAWITEVSTSPNLPIKLSRFRILSEPTLLKLETNRSVSSKVFFTLLVFKDDILSNIVLLFPFSS